MSEAERAQTFHVKPLWQRSLIVLAGPLTNLLFAVPSSPPHMTYGRIVAEPVISGFAANSPAAAAGLKAATALLR